MWRIVALTLLVALGSPIAALAQDKPGADELLIGLPPERNVFDQVRRYLQIERYIEETTDLRIQFTILPRYENIVHQFTKKGLDGAFWGSFTGAVAIARLGMVPLVKPVNLDGTSTYHGHIYVRKDSGIKTVADMRGRSIVFVDKATTAGYVFPVAFFRENGVEDLDHYFRTSYFAGSHDAALLAVLNKEVDIGCAKNTVFDALRRTNPRLEDELVSVAESPRVPSNGLGLGPKVPKESAAVLRNALLGMSKTERGKASLKAFGAIRFVVATRDDYEPVFELAKRAGIDIAKHEKAKD